MTQTDYIAKKGKPKMAKYNNMKGKNFMSIEEAKTNIEEVLNAIKISTEAQIIEGIVEDISNYPFDTMERGRLAVGIQNRLHELHNVKHDLIYIKSLLRFKGDVIKAAQVPNWCKKYLYIIGEGQFINIKNGVRYKSNAFDIENSHYITNNKNIEKYRTATKYVTEKGFVKRVDLVGYLPQSKDKIVYYDNKCIYNTFDHNSLPKPANSISEDAKNAIEFIKKHISYIVGIDNQENFLQWLACQVQFPGKKLKFTPIVQGYPGSGKSFFSVLLRRCLGEKNVGTIALTNVLDKYNLWAVNKCVNIFEEIRVQGSSKYEVMNKLKPLVTDDVIDIRAMHTDSYNARNYTNYIGFTNHKDALHLEEDDRRYWCLCSPFDTIEQLEHQTGLSSTAYFDKLYNTLDKYIPEIVKYLLELKITDKFLSIDRAPHTPLRQFMINSAKTANIEEGYAEVEEKLLTGGVGFRQECFCSSLLIDAVHSDPDNSGLYIDNTKRNKIFKLLGYSQHPDRINWNRGRYFVWYKNALTKEQHLKLLDETIST